MNAQDLVYSQRFCSIREDSGHWYELLAQDIEDPTAPVLIGTCSISVERNEVPEPHDDESRRLWMTYHLSALWVDPKWRNSGVGSKLIERAVKLVVRELGFPLSLAVRYDNPARRLYVRKGFVPTGLSSDEPGHEIMVYPGPQFVVLPPKDSA